MTADLSAFVSSFISCRFGKFPLRALLCFSSRWCTKHAVLSRLSADCLANLGLSVVTIEDLRRWVFSGSNTTYLDTSARAIGAGGKGRDLKGMLILRVAGARVAPNLGKVSLLCQRSAQCWIGTSFA